MSKNDLKIENFSWKHYLKIVYFHEYYLRKSKLFKTY